MGSPHGVPITFYSSLVYYRKNLLLCSANSKEGDDEGGL